MKQYQTGELADLCNVTVRTVQFYEKKGLLNARKSTITPHGRRLFDEESKETLQVILILKSFGFKLKDIQIIINEQVDLKVIRTMVSEREAEVEKEIKKLSQLQKEIKQYQNYISKSSIAPLNKLLNTHQIMKRNKYQNKISSSFIKKLLPIAFIQYGIIIFSILNKSWKPVVLNFPILMIFTNLLTYQHHQIREYLCPNCQCLFSPSFKRWVIAKHTPNTRKLECVKCKETNYCIATTK